MGIPVNEQETTISWYRDDKYASVYTSDTTMMTRYDKYVASGEWLAEGVGRVQGQTVSKTYLVPKELVFGRSKKKKLSEQTRKNLSERMAAMHQTDQT